MELSVISPLEQPEALRKFIWEAGLRFPEQPDTPLFWTGLSLNDRLIACAAIEVYENDGLLRSVAVAKEYRGKSYGAALLKAAVILARLKKLRSLYLFTENAKDFFEQHGFKPMERTQLPANITSSEQAAQECGIQAHVMYRAVPESPPLFLVLCTGNSCRSQMAHAYLAKYLAGRGSVYSAGVETHGLNPGAVSILMEDGLDITQHTSNHVDEYGHLRFDFILTVCDHARETCPWIPGNALRIHHNFSDPSKVKGSHEEVHSAFLRTREEISSFCRKLAEALNPDDKQSIPQ
jgi:arsenate reductase